jgi:negative regulator of sigma E activity
VKTRKCWVVDLHAPQQTGEYGIVRIFVDRESGGLMRVQAYDWQGQMVKVLAVTSGMKVDGATVLKSMDVIRYAPGTKKVVGETTFELKKP